MAAVAAKVPKVKFNNGHEIPIFGLGTWKSKPGEVGQAVKDAIDAGYRHLDCAFIYGNEPEIGAAIQAKIAEGVIKRSDLFITSKLWNSFHRPDLVESACRKTLSNFGVDYLDLYLIHWPVAYKEEMPELIPKDASGKILYSDADYVDTWKEMEKLVQKGLVRSIGLSNFNTKQIERVLAVATVKPVNNQIECNPYLNQKKLIEFCKARDITVTAYSPLGSADNPFLKPGSPKLLDDEKLKKIGQKYKKTAAQVVLRYQIRYANLSPLAQAHTMELNDTFCYLFTIIFLMPHRFSVPISYSKRFVPAITAKVQRGIITIPKSVSKSRILENIDIFDFNLSSEDMQYLDTFDCGGRITTLEHASDHKHYPFNIEF